MSEATLLLLGASFLLISALYSCVGQGGASGYIAAMALFGFAPAAIRPTALVLNILVSAIVSIRFYRSGYFSWRLFKPFAISSVPAAILGGGMILPTHVFSQLLGALLLLAAIPFFIRRPAGDLPCTPPHPSLALLSGAVIGLLAGLTGVGGGILITPLLLYCQWAPPRVAAAVSGMFILVNSVAALLGHLTTFDGLPANLPWLAVAAVTGGVIGAHVGCTRFSERTIFRILGIILLLAGCKLVLSTA